jgi:hypothetical protein
MFIREGANKSSLPQWRPGVRRDFEDRDFDSVCRLQTLIGELLVKNELLRRQLHRNGLILEKVQQVLEADRPACSGDTDLIRSMLQAHTVSTRPR